MHVKPDMAVPLNVDMAPTGNILTAVVPSSMYCRKYVLTKKKKSRLTQAYRGIRVLSSWYQSESL